MTRAEEIIKQIAALFPKVDSNTSSNKLIIMKPVAGSPASDLWKAVEKRLQEEREQAMRKQAMKEWKGFGYDPFAPFPKW